MTVIIDMGDWWIEQLLVPIPINDGAGFYNSGTIVLSRGGRIMSFAQSLQNMPNNDASQTMGGIFTINSTGALLNLGDFIASIIVQVQKTASTSGAQTPVAIVTLFMRR